MTDVDPRVAHEAFTRALVADLRAHAGEVTSGPFMGRPVLLLTTTGAHSGLPRLAPLVYSRDGDRLVVVASKGGAPVNPKWFANLVANPVVTVEARGETFPARAIVAEGADRDRLWAAHVRQHPGFAEYERKTTRQIPVISLERLDEPG
jgi:deazaflavin-dependent oxidoreductase (nitroreductase family)